MRVLHVIETLGKGGAEQALVNLLPSLQEIGVTCHVAVLSPPFDLVDKINDLGVTLHFLNIGHRWNAISAILKIRKIAKENEYDIIHSHLFFPGIYSALSRPLARHPKRIVSYHNLDYDSYPANTLYKKIRKKLDQFCMRRLIDAHSAVSQSVFKHYEKHLNIKITSIIPNAIPEPKISSESIHLDKELLHLIEGNSFNILLPGRLVHEKGHRYAIDAIKVVCLSRKNIRLIIVGDGPLREKLGAYIEEDGLSDNVLIHSAVEQEQLFILIKKVDCCLFPSTHEGWGLAAAEAMVLGKLVIASNVGGLAEIISHNKTGILVPAGSVDALVSAIEFIITNENIRNDIEQHAKEQIINAYNPDKIARDWCFFYKKTIASC